MADDLAGKRAVTSFARIPHDAVPAIREAVRDPLLVIPAGPVDVAVLKARTADAWHVWHQSTRHRTDVGRLLPRLVTDAWIAARAAEGQDRRAVHAVLADVHAWEWRSPAPTISATTIPPCCTGWSRPTRPPPTRCATPPRPADDRRSGRPRPGPDQPQGALTGPEHRPAGVARAHGQAGSRRPGGSRRPAGSRWPVDRVGGSGRHQSQYCSIHCNTATEHAGRTPAAHR